MSNWQANKPEQGTHTAHSDAPSQDTRDRTKKWGYKRTGGRITRKDQAHSKANTSLKPLRDEDRVYRDATDACDGGKKHMTKEHGPEGGDEERIGGHDEGETENACEDTAAWAVVVDHHAAGDEEQDVGNLTHCDRDGGEGERDGKVGDDERHEGSRGEEEAAGLDGVHEGGREGDGPALLRKRCGGEVWRLVLCHGWVGVGAWTGGGRLEEVGEGRGAVVQGNGMQRARKVEIV